ncbi:MAG: esterase [Sulfurovum sp.]|nr:MAG: esterase [Sulfurovum sp.]
MYKNLIILLVLMISINARPFHNGLDQHKNITKISDISYGKDRLQKLDVYYKNGIQNAPIIIMVHGGAWHMGDKDRFKTVDNKVSRWIPKGAIVVSVNYRLLPKADPQIQADDVVSAMVYVQKHAKVWGGNAKNIILMGHSSGGHLVSLIATTSNRYNRLKPWLGTIILDSSALNIIILMQKKHNALYDNAFGQDQKYWESISPAHHLHARIKPMLLVCSIKRFNNPCGIAEKFSKKAKVLGVRTQIIRQTLNHFEINEELGKENAYTLQVEEFIRSLGVKL